MKPIEVKEYFVTWANAMRRMGLSANAYGRWVRKGYIPIDTQRKIEQTTNGRLKSDG